MKNIIAIISVFCLLLMFVTSSCKKNVATKANDIRFDSISISDGYRIADNDTAPVCTINVKYLYPVQYANEGVRVNIQKELNLAFFENEDLKDLNPADATNTYLKAYIDNYKRDIKEQYTDDEELPPNYFTYNQSLSNKITFNGNDLLSYQVIITDKKGGTKSANLYRNLVFDLKTGHSLSEPDIFVAGYKEGLNAMLIKKIMEQNNAKTMDELYEMGFYNLDDFDSNDNFLIDAKGITYIYNQLGFSTNSIGETVIFIPFAEITHLLKSNSPISPLYN